MGEKVKGKERIRLGDNTIYEEEVFEELPDHDHTMDVKELLERFNISEEEVYEDIFFEWNGEEIEEENPSHPFVEPTVKVYPFRYHWFSVIELILVVK